MRTSTIHPAVYAALIASAPPVAFQLRAYAEQAATNSSQAFSHRGASYGALQAGGQNESSVRDAPQRLALAQPVQALTSAPTNAGPAYLLSFGNASLEPTNNLLFPGGLCVDSAGNVYVSDTHHDRIQKYTGQGVYLTQWGQAGSNAACFNYPQGLATDGSANVYVTDTHNHRIQKFSFDGAFLLQWGHLGSTPGDFNDPYSVAVNSAGNVLVADADNDRVEEFNGQGNYLGSFGHRGSNPGEFNSPKSVALDRSDNIYIADTGNGRIQKFTPDGVLLGGWGSSGNAPGQFDVAHDVAVDPWGGVYVADADGSRHNNRIQLFASDGSLLAMWGTLGTAAGQFNFASRVALDPTGQYIYVCDASNNRVQMFAYAAP